MTDFTSLALTGIAFSPLAPWQAIAALAAIALLLLLYGIVRGASCSILRLGALGIVVLALFNPHLTSENRRPQNDIAIVAIDESSSQNTGDRKVQLADTLKKVREKISQYKDLEYRIINTRETDNGTELFSELNRALTDLPKGRFAGAVVISDGQIHDLPSDSAKEYGKKIGGPLHLMLTGRKGERDRRLIVERAPAYGIVGKKIKIRLRVEDNPKKPTSSTSGRTARLTIRLNGGPKIEKNIQVGRTKTFSLPVEHGGASIVEMVVQPIANEMSLANNRAVITINGVRDRLKVLLVSGQPHLGERTWRNLLKSDPSVDLVHFTILRPPEKNDFTPLNELALISFPIRELFEIKLHEFDLVVFDRYVVRFVLPPNYFQNIEDYVRNGGAILTAVGPDFSGLRSLYHTPLGKILPGQPMDSVIETPFRAQLTEKGRRHPVTAGLPGLPEKWGRWFRLIEANPKAGHTLLTGTDKKPLLLLDRIGKGRVAQFMSDHVWLWARGFEGGGPHAELLRRLSHWLMKEPDLEEEDLRAKVDGKTLTIERRSLGPENPPITLTAPSGKKTIVKLKPNNQGGATTTLRTDETGLYQISDGTKRILTAVGKLNPPELADLRASSDLLAPMIKASGGSVKWIADGVPDFRRTKPGRNTKGNGWMGLVKNGAYVVTGARQVSLLPALLFLLLAGGGIMLSWWREGR